jgi:hypothetical protein
MKSARSMLYVAVHNSITSSATYIYGLAVLQAVPHIIWVDYVYLHVVVYGPSLLHRADDGGKVVVRKDHVGGVLRRAQQKQENKSEMEQQPKRMKSVHQSKFKVNVSFTFIEIIVRGVLRRAEKQQNKRERNSNRSE